MQNAQNKHQMLINYKNSNARNTATLICSRYIYSFNNIFMLLLLVICFLPALNASFYHEHNHHNRFTRSLLCTRSNTYGACFYIRTISQHGSDSHLLCSESRISPSPSHLESSCSFLLSKLGSYMIKGYFVKL